MSIGAPEHGSGSDFPSAAVARARHKVGACPVTMTNRVLEKELFKNYPLLSRLEWHFSRSRYFAYGLGHFIAPLRSHWHNWRRRRRLLPESLTHFESRIFSQNGEDGILQEIFRRIGEGHKASVEFGIGDGTECCTRNLLVNCGWTGLLMEGSRGRRGPGDLFVQIFPTS